MNHLSLKQKTIFPQPANKQASREYKHECKDDLTLMTREYKHKCKDNLTLMTKITTTEPLLSDLLLSVFSIL